MKIKTGQGNMTLQKLIAIYSISMVTSLPGLAISPILGKLESIFSSTSELQLQMLESLPSFIIVPFILLAGRMSLYFNTKKLLITGLAIFSACSIAYPFADRMWALLLISGLLGIGAGLVILRSLTSRWLSPLYWPVFWPVSAGIYPLSYIVSQVFPCFSHSIWTKNHLSIPLRPKRQLRFNSRRHIIIKNTTG